LRGSWKKFRKKIQNFSQLTLNSLSTHSQKLQIRKFSSFERSFLSTHSQLTLNKKLDFSRGEESGLRGGLEGKSS